MEDLSYPIGKFRFRIRNNRRKTETVHRQNRCSPRRTSSCCDRAIERALDSPYRPGGWTVRQVVHHLPDSHINAYVRFRLALTENEPTIKPYEQQLWTAPRREDGGHRNVLEVIGGFASKVGSAFAFHEPRRFPRKFIHPENGVNDLDRTLQMYAWHGKHHVAHITSLRKRMRWCKSAKTAITFF